MLKTFAEYIVSNAAPVINYINGQVYSDKKLNRISYAPKAEPIHLTTLTSLLDFIKSEYDVPSGINMFIHIESPTKVRLFSTLDDEREREVLAEVHAEVPRFDFNRFIDHEPFTIGVQSKFLDDLDRPILLKFSGTVENGTVSQYGDDGVTQKATIKTGIASKSDAIVPNPVNLRAFRTFIECNQPSASYIFRMKESGGNIQCALFEADGGEWESRARNEIKSFLVENLSNYPNIIVLS